MAADAPSTLPAALQQLEAAREDYRKADKAYSEANRDRNTCLGRLNAAQKAFDQVVAELRKDCPRDSNWYQAELASGRA
ncbi:hypothetical protein [Zavarzinia aquatilis]|uniref:Uncharacterized protein n=1 Tax=Zavarzinia aquatilis TaxID=2211142 RepID=A0A317ED56_9PROT|nr:hypothetical protein [Zavarzinia aquatilis]PWR24967.1 hypothetical protein DKG74_04150 [Zavarzinia aquatilis]